MHTQHFKWRVFAWFSWHVDKCGSRKKPPSKRFVGSYKSLYLFSIPIHSSILTDTGQWDTQAARTQRQDASGSAASPVSANNGDESAANSPGTEGSADKIVPLLDIGLSTIHSAVEQLFDIGSASDTSDTASAEVEHAIEAPPFSSDDADAGDVIAINDVGIENAAAAVAVEPSAELPNAAGGILASAGGEGAFVLLDAVSTNSGING